MLCQTREQMECFYKYSWISINYSLQIKFKVDELQAVINLKYFDSVNKIMAVDEVTE